MILFAFLSLCLCNGMPNFLPLNQTVNVHSIAIDRSQCSHYSLMHVHVQTKFEHNTAVDNIGLYIKYPQTFYLLRCHNLTLRGGYVVSEATYGDQFIDESVVLANDIAFPDNLQHELINGITSLALAWRWFVANDHVKALAGVYVTRVLQNTLGEQRVLRIEKRRQKFKELFIVAPVWHGGVTHDCYSPHTLSEILRDYTIADQLSPPARRRVVYFSRDNTAKRTVQALDCTRNSSICHCEVVSQSEFHELLRQRVELYGFEFVAFQPVDFDADIALMRSAHVVFGPHGGAFMNLVWLLPGSKVIEINAGVRQCYACLSGSVDAEYYRYLPLFWPEDYDRDGTIQIESRDFQMFLDSVLQDEQPQSSAAPPCKIKISN